LNSIYRQDWQRISPPAVAEVVKTFEDVTAAVAEVVKTFENVTAAVAEVVKTFENVTTN